MASGGGNRPLVHWRWGQQRFHRAVLFSLFLGARCPQAVLLDDLVSALECP